MTTGILRVKNEKRWIVQAVRSIQQLCDRIVVFDDHSTDGTPYFVQPLAKVKVIRSPFEGLDESRDKNYLLDRERDADWVVMIDGDEILAPGAVDAIAHEMRQPGAQVIAPRILFLWNDREQVRVDGVYRSFHRPSVFRPGKHRFEGSGKGPNFHCGNAPLALQRIAVPWDGASILHMGYLDKADRIRKYEWYNQQDPDNMHEDMYRHMVCGDVFPSDSKMKHGGPLELKPLADVLPMTHRVSRADAAE